MSRTPSMRVVRAALIAAASAATLNLGSASASTAPQGAASTPPTAQAAPAPAAARAQSTTPQTGSAPTAPPAAHAASAPPRAAAASPAPRRTAASSHRAAANASKSGAPDSTQAAAGDRAPSANTLKGDREGTVFQSLTIEAEDRVHVDFDRPELKVDLDEDKAPGLEWGSARDVLERTQPDLMAPLAAQSTTGLPATMARPWLGTFAVGAVARFHPAVEGVDHWRLLVADSHGQVVSTFSGSGKPPHEIAWDGRTASGTPATPGLTYSYVFEAFDRAGNKRNFVGRGFTVPAYRLDTPAGPVLTFGGASLTTPSPTSRSATPQAPSIVLEAASWINQSERITQPIRVTAAARTTDQAQSLADRVTRSLAPIVAGDPNRIKGFAVVQPDAPESGTVTIAPAVGGSR